MKNENSDHPNVLFMEARENLFGHRRQNEAILKSLSAFANVTAVYPKGWLDCTLSNVVVKEFKPKSKLGDGSLAQILKSYRYLKYARQLDMQYAYDYIFFPSYIIYTVPLIKLMFHNSQCRVYVLHHNILDQISKSRFVSMLFNVSKNSFQHIFIEDFMKNSFLEISGVPKDKVYCIPHQLNVVEKTENVIYDYVGISNSNDEAWVDQVIDAERKNAVFKKVGIRIVVRSKYKEYDDGFLTVINKRLTDEEYYRYIACSKCVLVPFPSDFKYRVSGTLVDALSNNKVVLGSKIPVIEYYANKYPNVCKVGVDIQTLSNMKIEIDDTGKESFSEFKRLHSKEELKKSLKQIFSASM